MKKFILWSILILAILVIIGSMVDETSDTKVEQINTPTKTNKNIQQPANTGIYTTDESRLMSAVIDQNNYISMVDVQYALARLVDDDPRIFEYPFYAMKNQKGEGYIGIMVTNTGKALFLVPYKALNQTGKSDLEQSIKAINGTAKNLNYNLSFATGYDALEVLEWVK